MENIFFFTFLLIYKKINKKTFSKAFSPFAMRLEIKLRCIPFPLIILETFLQIDWSPPVVQYIDWTWFGKANTCVYKVPNLKVHVRAKTKPWGSKELSVELRDKIVSRHRSGDGYQQMSSALKVHKNTMASIILKWKKFGTTNLFLELSNRGRRALVR